MHCTVLRPISGPHGPLEAGQVVDTATWRPRNRDVLIARKYLRAELTYGLTSHTSTPELPEPAPKPGKKEGSHGA